MQCDSTQCDSTQYNAMPKNTMLCILIQMNSVKRGNQIIRNKELLVKNYWSHYWHWAIQIKVLKGGTLLIFQPVVTHELGVKPLTIHNGRTENTA